MKLHRVQTFKQQHPMRICGEAPSHTLCQGEEDGNVQIIFAVTDPCQSALQSLRGIDCIPVATCKSWEAFPPTLSVPQPIIAKDSLDRLYSIDGRDIGVLREGSASLTNAISNPRDKFPVHCGWMWIWSATVICASTNSLEKPSQTQSFWNTWWAFWCWWPCNLLLLNLPIYWRIRRERRAH